MPELEKTVGLMKKVVERAQRENEALKKSGRSAGHTKLASLQQENLRLKVQHVPQMPHLCPLPRGPMSSSLSPLERE